jgi:hypothetical protein
MSSQNPAKPSPPPAITKSPTNSAKTPLSAKPVIAPPAATDRGSPAVQAAMEATSTSSQGALVQSSGEPPPGFAPFGDEESRPLGTVAPLLNTQVAVAAALAATSTSVGSGAKAAVAVQKWPTMVPNLEQATGIITGESEPSPELRGVTRQLIKSLAGPQRQALMDEGTVEFGTLLKRVVAIRWRVAAAIALKEFSKGEVDAAQVDLLFNEVDSAIAEVSAALTNAAATSQEALSAVRGDLARDAVTLSEALQKIAAEDSAASDLPKYARKAQARLTKVFGEDEGPTISTNQKISLGLAGVLLLASVAYHAVIFLQPPVLRPSELAIQSPKGTKVSGTESVGAVVGLDNRKISDADVEKMRAEAEKLGKVLYQVSPNQFMFALPETAHHSANDSKTEGSMP